MYNWTVNTSVLKKYRSQYAIWKLEQLINFGLKDEKISKNLLKKHIDRLNIDPEKRKYLQFLLKKDEKNENSVKRSNKVH
ncbi:hypothetical protein A2982_03690 [candidate division WWE3 bacterium RIFCSPLOWO2_01_FULL_39_13]|uniref:Uncharacterized protein n=1 Tax=candidate division WWE3 bacterium RIFCSPLOWO2_01_FULL_39_13 TaxID=1802624 RepID=A0A1F4V5C0_UNCKA|nr:MAG: hypothetical protein A2982_03690 [candidate division WWE3 bacterium RIFCSPLOWO2_01_FULL_39_13]